MRGESDTRGRILDVAERLVMQRGYHAFSYQHIASELQIRAPAVHYHFRTKPDLVAAVLQRYRDQFRAWAAAHADAPPAAQLDAYLALTRGFVEASRVCALGMMSADFNVVPDDLREQTRALHGEIHGWIRDVLRRGRDAGVLAFDGSPGAKATELTCAVLGAQQVARVHGVAAFDVVAGQLRRGVTPPD